VDGVAGITSAISANGELLITMEVVSGPQDADAAVVTPTEKNRIASCAHDASAGYDAEVDEQAT